MCQKHYWAGKGHGHYCHKHTHSWLYTIKGNSKRNWDMLKIRTICWEEMMNHINTRDHLKPRECNVRWWGVVKSVAVWWCGLSEGGAVQSDVTSGTEVCVLLVVRNVTSHVDLPGYRTWFLSQQLKVYQPSKLSDLWLQLMRPKYHKYSKSLWLYEKRNSFHQRFHSNGKITVHRVLLSVWQPHHQLKRNTPLQSQRQKPNVV